MNEQEITNALAILSDLESDTQLPKNVRSSVTRIIGFLKNSDEDISIRVDKAMQELEEICSDINVQAYSRTQIYHVVSMLENSL